MCGSPILNVHKLYNSDLAAGNTIHTIHMKGGRENGDNSQTCEGNPNYC